jgi:hypothetical protein
MYYYLILGHEGDGYPNEVLGVVERLAPIEEETAGDITYLGIPDFPEDVLFGYRYLGELLPRVQYLGPDYMDHMEAPPAVGCYWGGTDWVCPENE